MSLPPVRGRWLGREVSALRVEARAARRSSSSSIAEGRDYGGFRGKKGTEGGRKKKVEGEGEKMKKKEEGGGRFDS